MRGSKEDLRPGGLVRRYAVGTSGIVVGGKALMLAERLWEA